MIAAEHRARGEAVATAGVSYVRSNDYYAIAECSCYAMDTSHIASHDISRGEARAHGPRLEGAQ